MIAGIPAIAVGRGKKADGSIGFIGRPNKLSLHFRPPTHQSSPTPSPVNSPQASGDRAVIRLARKLLGKRCFFQLSVLAPVVGAMLLFIGVIQLTPGAEASPYSTPLISAGSAALGLGVIVIVLYKYFKWELKRLNAAREVPQIKVNEPTTEGDVERGEEQPLQPQTQAPIISTETKVNEVTAPNQSAVDGQEEGSAVQKKAVVVATAQNVELKVE